MYLCEQCGKEVYEKYGSGRFCSRSCSNKYVALHQSSEAKDRKVEAGKKNLRRSNYVFTNSDRIKACRSTADTKRMRRKEWLESVLETGGNAWKGSHSYFRDVLVEFGYKEWKCDCCNNTEWMGQKIPLEVHHVNGGSNKLDNIQFLCPNCHAQTPNYRWRSHNSRKNKKGDD